MPCQAHGIIVGKCNIENGVAVDSQDTKGFSLTCSGISTDVYTSYAGMIMAISVVPFVIVQLPQMLHSNSGRHLAVLIALIVSISLLISYCLYQVSQPWIQRRWLVYAKHKHVVSGILKHLKKRSLGRLSQENGKPNEHVLKELFEAIDENKDGCLSYLELKALIVGVKFNQFDMDLNDTVHKVFKDFDTTHDEN